MDWLDSFNQEVQEAQETQGSPPIAPAQLQADIQKEPILPMSTVEGQNGDWLDAFDTQVQEAQKVLEVPLDTKPDKTFESWFDEKYSGAKEFLEASGEAAVQLGYGAISFLPSYGMGFATMLNEKLKNVLRQDRIEETVRRGGFPVSPGATDLARKPMAQRLEEAKIKTPKEIRALADKSSEFFASVMEEPVTPGGKKIVGKAGELMEWLFHYPKLADEKLAEAGYPNLGYLTGFAGEMLLLKGLHGAAKKGKKVGKETISRFIKTVEDTKSIKTPSDLKAVSRQVDKILDQLGITEEQRIIATDKTFRAQKDVGSWIEERSRIKRDAKEVPSAKEITREAKAPSKEERIERGEERPVRLRDVEKDRLEAPKEREVAVEVKPEVELPKPSVRKLNVEEQFGKRVAGEVSDGIKIAEDMGVFETIRACVEGKKKVGEIMKEVKESRYYEEDLKDFGYSEKDLRNAIRAVKVREFGDVKIAETLKTKLEKEVKRVERIERIKEPKAKEPVELPAEMLGKDLKKHYPSIPYKILDRIGKIEISDKYAGEGTWKADTGLSIKANKKSLLHEVGHIVDNILTEKQATVWENLSESKLQKGILGNKPVKLASDSYSIWENLYTAFSIYHRRVSGEVLSAVEKTAFKNNPEVFAFVKKNLSDIKAERVDIERGRTPGVKADLKKYEQPSRVKEELAEIKIRKEAEMAPLRTAEGKIVGSKVLAMRMAKSRGLVGEVVRTPDKKGWYVKKTKEMKAKEVEVTKKFWDEMLKEEGMEVLEPETGMVRGTVEVLKSERGSVEINSKTIDKIKKLSPLPKQILKLGLDWYNSGGSPFYTRALIRNSYKDLKLTDVQRKVIAEELGKDLGELKRRIERPLNNKPASDKIKENRQRSQDNVLMSEYLERKVLFPLREGQIKRLSRSYSEDPKHRFYGDRFKANEEARRIIDKLHAQKLKGQSLGDITSHIKTMTERFKTDVLTKELKRKVVDLGIIRSLMSEKGAVTISAETIKKLRDSVKRKKVSEADLVAEMQRRKVPNGQILRAFPNVFKKTAVEGTSEFLKRGQRPEELLARRVLKKGKAGKPGRLAPAVTRGDAHVVSTVTKDLPRPIFGEKVRTLATSEGLFTQLGKPLKEAFYYPMRKAAKAENDFVTTLVKESNRMKKTFKIGTRQRHSERIEKYSIAQQPDGLARLKNQGVKDIPKKLTPKEKAVYDEQQLVYRSLYKEINKAREAAGQQKFLAVENYSPWFHDLAKLQEFEKINILDNLGKINQAMTRLREIPSQIEKVSRAPGLAGHEKFRAGPETPGYLHLNTFDNFNSYAKLAGRAIHIGPTTAYLHELLLPRYKLAENAPNTWRFISDWLDYQKGHEPIMYVTNPVTRRRMKSLSSNVAVSYITYNWGSMLNQASSINNTMALLGLPRTVEGFVRVLNPAEHRRAAAKSDVLTVRSPETALMEAGRPYPLVPGKVGRFISDVTRKIKTLGSAGLMMSDSLVANASWLGAEAKAKQLFKSSKTYKELPTAKRTKALEKFSKEYADDVVEQAQGSAARAARAPFQRTAEGAAMSTLQTFVIANFDFLSRQVLGIKNPDITNIQRVQRLTRYVASTAAIAYTFDFMGMRSPVPDPVKAAKEEAEKLGYVTDIEKYTKISKAIGKEMLEYVPIYGGKFKYGSEFGGALVNELVKLGNGDATAIPRLLGIPGFQQFVKSYRAAERGGTNIDIIFGRYIEKSKKGRVRRQAR